MRGSAAGNVETFFTSLLLCATLRWPIGAIPQFPLSDFQIPISGSARLIDWRRSLDLASRSSGRPSYAPSFHCAYAYAYTPGASEEPRLLEKAWLQAIKPAILVLTLRPFLARAYNCARVEKRRTLTFSRPDAALDTLCIRALIVCNAY